MTRALVLALALAGCPTAVPEVPDPACPELLACPEPVEVDCSAPETPVEVADASVCAVAETTDDRLATYPLGDTTVTFHAALAQLAFDRTATCATRVTVVDRVAPEVTCEASVTLVRPAADAPMPDVPRGTATDTCDPDVTLTVTPDALTERFTDVVTTATDGSGNVGDCTTEVEVLDVFPVPGFRLLGAVLDDADDTVLTLGWEPPDSADVEAVDVQRGPSADGPWETVTTVTAPTQVVSLSQREGAWYRLRSVGRDLDGGATEPLRVHAVARDAYDFRNIPVSRVPFPTSIYGVVRHPTDLDGGPYPLILLMHGNHGNCRRTGTTNDYCGTLTEHDCTYDGYTTAPNAEGLAYVAESLAARGFIAATVSANALNCRSGYILERAQLLRRHLEFWKAFDAGDLEPLGSKMAGRVDLTRVGLIGHSRGGDAVSQVPKALADAPLDGVDVVSIFAIAPTDYNDATVFDSSWAVLLPACDGDVTTLWGTDIHERSKTDVPHKSQVFFPGANHNFFNTEWFWDDGQRACAGGDRVGKLPQTTMLQDSVGAWFERTLDGDAPEPAQRAEVRSPGSLDRWAERPVDLRWSYTQDDALLVDTFTGDPDVNDVDGVNAWTDLEEVRPCVARGCSSAFLAPTSAIRLSWREGAAPIAVFDLGGLDTASFDAVALRIASNASGSNDGRTQQPFRLVVTDVDGNVAELDSTSLPPVPHLYGGYNRREVLQTVRVPFATLEAASPDLDTSRIADVAVELGVDGRSGSVSLTDVQLGY